ncbi:putative esterase tox9 [Plenodomus lingam]|uniref:putative esterase tox9 n=1 Tax=Leptosphaeria maculans TaxID=5022 RepID=UPI00331968E8|nr:putative esterase tox9 [Plenodomus lingam]
MIGIGVGSNADILSLQTRVLRDQLSSKFRFVFANGPFFCEPGPGVLPAYGGAEPFRRWLRWSPSHRVLKPKYHIEAIRQCLEDSMMEDDEAGADGPWVGLLGFSQGARLSASLLFETQRRQAIRASGGTITGYEGTDVTTKLWSQDWQFGIFFSGPAPLVALSPDLGHLPLQSPTELDLSYKELDQLDPSGKVSIKRPTLHVIGVEDEWTDSQRRLYDAYCPEESKTLLEWQGDHRIPIQASETKQICDWILARAGGK